MEFLRGVGARGVEVGDDWAEEINAVCRILNSCAEVLVAIDGMSYRRPTWGVNT
jgi:hypothetical protein